MSLYPTVTKCVSCKKEIEGDKFHYRDEDGGWSKFQCKGCFDYDRWIPIEYLEKYHSGEWCRHMQVKVEGEWVRMDKKRLQAFKKTYFPRNKEKAQH